MSFQEKYVNKSVYSNSSSSLKVMMFPSSLPKTNLGKSNLLTEIPAGKNAGRTSGTYYKTADGVWFVLSLVTPVNGRAYGYFDANKAVFKEGVNNSSAQQNGQSLVNDLVETDKKIFDILVSAATKIKALKAKSKNVSIQEKTLADLYVRLDSRQKHMKDSNVLKYQAGVKKGTETAVSNARSFMDSIVGDHPEMWETSPIYGVGSIIATIIISAVVGAGLAVTAYYMFKPDYEDSKKDLQVSQTLQKALDALTPKEQEAVKADLERQIDDAYNSGKTDQKFSDIGSGVKNVLLILGGVFIAWKALGGQSQQQRKTA